MRNISVRLAILGYAGFFGGSFLGGFLVGATGSVDNSAGVLAIILLGIFGIGIGLSFAPLTSLRLVAATIVFYITLVVVRYVAILLDPVQVIALLGEVVGAVLGGHVVSAMFYRHLHRDNNTLHADEIIDPPETPARTPPVEDAEIVGEDLHSEK